MRSAVLRDSHQRIKSADKRKEASIATSFPGLFPLNLKGKSPGNEVGLNKGFEILENEGQS